MTLDRSCNPAIKGHFPSLLISNIFCYPLFRSLSFAAPFSSLSKHLNLYFSNENTFLFQLKYSPQKKIFPTYQ